MKTRILTLILFCSTINFYGQINCLKANGPDLLETKKDVKYGEPFCLEVSGVNNFLNKSFSTYVPINYDFSVKSFLDIKIDDKKETTPVADNPKSKADNLKLNEYFFSMNKVYDLNTEISNKQNFLDEHINDNSIDKNQLEKEIATLIQERDKLKSTIEKLEKENKNLNRKLDSITNIKIKSEEFKIKFKEFQEHFYNINNYSTLKSTLVKQIKKDNLFIKDVQGFKDRSSSSFKAIYKTEDNPLDEKAKIIDELSNLETKYTELTSIFQQLNTLFKNKELKLTGELKDGKNTLKFDKIIASFETKYLFGEEMNKAKVINDSLVESKNRQNIINETQEGIDLYHEIINNDFKLTIISDNVYDDKAKIKPQIKDKDGKVLHEYREFKLNSYGNWKINGSAGYFLNFISDDNYSLRKKDETIPTSKSGVNQNNENVLKHSLGGLLHAYYNLKGSVDIGASVGLSINDSANAGFYIGLSGFFTETNRLVLTTGISFVKVSKLNTTNLIYNDVTKEYDFLNQSDTEIKYDEIYRPSFFVGISYNLF